MTAELPQPIDQFDIALDDGAAAVVRRHGNPDAPVRLFMSHGNGFAIDGYAAFWAPLGERFDLIAFDFRNHGRNAPSDPANHHYGQFARDLATIHGAVTGLLGAKRNVGVFHSMSGRTAMKDAVETGWRWDALVLFDPPNFPPPGHPLYDKAKGFEMLLANWAAARRDRFADPAELAAEYARTRAHRSWVEGAHLAMARAVLRRDAAAGDWALVCPRELESDVYRQNIPLNLWPPASAYGGPVALIASDPGLEGAMVPALANHELGTRHGYDYTSIPGTGHLLQIQKPAECRAAMTAFLERCGLPV
ncbi:MAG: alpha/beta fold hydrolase [Rhodospirillales bacterium]